MADNDKDLDKPLGEAGYRALVDERAANKDLKAEVKRLEGELEVAKGEVDTHRTRADELKQKLKDRDDADALSKLKEQVAKDKSKEDGPEVPVAFLQGTTKEELEASADAFLSYLGETIGPRPPKAAPTQGQTHGTNDGASDDLNALAILGFGEE